ncbi:MAG: LapA family protein [Alphaproteobacteria bacterium]|nr:LapA family protein [Alphaproteobacteria bacterium SS10]
MTESKKSSFLGRVIGMPVIAICSLVLISFALSNRGPVELSLFPLPGAVAMPMFLPLLVFMLLGAFIGGFVSWRNGAAARKAKRAAERRVRELEDDTKRLNAELAKRPPPPAPQAVLSPPNPLLVQEQPEAKAS